MVWFMGLTERLQSAPNSLPVALQSGLIMVRQFAHLEKKGAADLTKWTWTTAGLTAVPFLQIQATMRV